ncbi:MAG: alpha/beta hydrolase [Prevotella sp.]|nr:alpha/beta hydrolase [Prevotella sp.]
MTTSRLFSTVFSTLVCLTALAQEGAWTGKLDVQGMSLPLVFNFSADGCTLDSPAQGVKGIKGERTITEEGKLRVIVAAVGVTFEGLMEGDSIKGLFLQGGLSLPLTLRKGMMQMRRPQTPVSPFPYTTEEVRVASGNIVLSGTLTLPPNCNCNTPVVVLVTGSGQQNRDEEIFGHRPFAVLADALARHGIASLRYDDRGYGNAALDFSSFTTDDFKDDAEAVIRYLRNRFSRVGVIGHSEGGTIALMIAAEGKADYVVTMAAMAVSGLQTLVSQHRASLAQAFLPVTVLDAYSNALSDAFGKLANGACVEDIDVGNVPAMLREHFSKVLRQTSSPYMRHLLTIDVRPILSKIVCPVLAMAGKKDTQVDCEANLSALHAGLSACRHTILPFDGLNHLFQHCTTGNYTEYQQIEETMSVEVLDRICLWINDIR